MLFEINEETIDGSKAAVMSCYRCPYKEPVSPENPLVYEHILKEDKTTSLSLNKNWKNDVTLPRFDNIICPNEECPSHARGVQNEVVAVKLNEKNLIWMYQCVHCETSWKQASRVG